MASGVYSELEDAVKGEVVGQVSLGQMLKALDKDVAVNVEKKLKKLTKKRAIKVPLNKNKADQIERKIAYSSVSKEISRWEPIVDRNRRAKHLTFPLEQEPNLLPSTSEALGDLKPRNELEKEVLGAIGSSETVLHDNKELTKAEEKYLKAISVEEAEDRHRELQRMRVLLSSYAAKMRRQKAIKSKSYRRLLKHERIRRHVKNVESNKDLLMEEIERLQRLRAQERASLKHKNTGKWAKHAKFRSKYDEEARKAMLEQIGIAGKMLEKPAIDEDSDDSSEFSEEEDAISVDNELELNDEQGSDKKLETHTYEGGDDHNHDHDDHDQRELMKEAFAEDDIIAEFKDSKNRLADQEQPKDVCIRLPGWNDWAGPGIKNKKCFVKPKKQLRQDEKLCHVMISEEVSRKKDGLFEKRTPISGTFVSQLKHRELIKPHIRTRMGAKIEPLSKKSRGIKFIN